MPPSYTDKEGILSMPESERYCIKAGYITNIDPKNKVIGIDTIEDSKVFQYAVYEEARDLITRYCLTSVLDIGCGMAMKLAELIQPVCSDITGIDEPGTIAQCKQIHRFGRWYADDLENPTLNLNRDFDLIISADVIEHLVFPDQLLYLVRKHASNDTWIVLSTPERDIARGAGDMGPSPNNSHAREWNASEFRSYVEDRGFHVVEQFCCPTLRTMNQETARKSRLSVKKLLKTLIGKNPLRNSRRKSGGGTQVIVARIVK